MNNCNESYVSFHAASHTICKFSLDKTNFISYESGTAISKSSNKLNEMFCTSKIVEE